MRYRLIKPDWGKSGEIEGPNTIEGEDFSQEFLKEKNQLGYNVYYFPNHNSKKIEHPFLRGSDIDIFNCCFVDMDLKDGIYTSCDEFLELLVNDPLKPNKIVLSGNGVHAYWYLENLNSETYLELQLRLIQKFKTDESIWTILQLMRTPGFFNTKKKNDFKPVQEIELSTEKYKVEDLHSILPELSLVNKRKITMHIQKLNGVEELENIDEESIRVPEKFLELIQKSRKIQDLWSADVGDRSEADYQIACILYDKDYSKPEALAVIMNTSKAISKGIHRKSYAINVVSAAYQNNAKFSVKSAGEVTSTGILSRNNRGKPVNGPFYIDALNHGWRTSEVLGLIGSTNSGKTTLTLDTFYHMIKNSPEDDDIFMFFSLEMEDYKIIEQWNALTFDAPHLADRFFVVSNEDEEGNQRFLNLQDIYCYVKDTSKVTGKKVKAIAIDHIGIINKSIDIKRKPDFGLAKRDDLGFGNNRTLTDRELTKYLKAMAKELDVFMIVQSQTTKGKAGEGDIPLGLGAAYGVAQFEWDMDYVVTIWQPIRRVRNETDLAVTAFQYCKNRFVHKSDRLRVNQAKVLFVDLDCGRFRGLEEDEFEQFKVLEKKASLLRKMEEKKEGIAYTNSVDMDKLKEIMAKKLHLVEVR